MKTSKRATKTPAQEECGVWLDTAQLKVKAKQKRLARPISKLLNPFAGGDGYNVSVALNFTQTKVEMPKTKQSSISTFFTPQRRVLNKMSTSEAQSIDPVLPSSTSASATPVASGTKRRRELDLEPDVDPEQKSENEPESAEMWKETSYTPSQRPHGDTEEEQFEEVNPPQRKRRLTATSLLPDDSQPLLQAWSQDPLFSYSQFSESQFNLTNEKNTPTKNFNDSEPSFLNSLQSEEGFGIRMNVEARTSTQKSFQIHSSQVDNEKENSRFLSSKSPRKNSSLSHIEPFSNHKWTEPKTASPRKHNPAHLRKKSATEATDSHDSQFIWTKPSSSPVKKLVPQQSCRAADEDSLAMLFTQDSEGFRVIAHRGLQTRSPLKDQSNMSTGTRRTIAYKSLVEEDDEDEMLFTQDSQGNLVMKH
ncbi:Aurora kinase A and ninein-interacting protein [Larimichthys crocea]|uniref:Aurora kinase A and ninein-interacting protein n=1 Tax=Larimichthys crocea TaxID=215358 RepID=A0A6G0HS40_LARCR|nr:Aurora kinase A and ninein-interacting protein [Larimichthys crocea]